MTQVTMKNNQAEKQYMRKNNLNYSKKANGKKKKGFTLIEVIAVIAIIGMMASILLPKFTSYMNEAKKLKVVEQSRKVLMAVETYNMKAENTISMTDNVSKAKGTTGVSKYFEDIDTDTDKLLGTMTLQDCYDIVNGKDFNIDDSGVYNNTINSGTQGSGDNGSN